VSGGGGRDDGSRAGESRVGESRVGARAGEVRAETLAGAARPILLVKWGGSLITDKRSPESPRPAEIARLAGELAAGLPAARRRGLAVVLGHGSGSFGHVAAARHRLAEGLRADGPERDAARERATERGRESARAERDAAQLLGVGETQTRAAALHRLVLDALAVAGVPAFSIAPSSALVAEGGEPVACFAEPVARALAAGLLPVVYGDVVADRRQGVAIASTERVFLALAAALPEHGWRATEALWLGDTPGVLDTAGIYGETGRPIATLSPAEAARLSPGGSAGTDVTGGMAHRLAAAVRLAEEGAVSTIADGRAPGLLATHLATGTSPGTRLSAH
jgi:isopentenyl phosphate kinase